MQAEPVSVPIVVPVQEKNYVWKYQAVRDELWSAVLFRLWLYQFRIQVSGCTGWNEFPPVRGVRTWYWVCCGSEQTALPALPGLLAFGKIELLPVQSV